MAAAYPGTRVVPPSPARPIRGGPTRRFSSRVAVPVENFSADALALLDALHVDRAVLAGHSGSCLVARRVAIEAPERVGGLVLEASPTTLHGNMTLMAFVESISELADPIDPDFARSFLADTSLPYLASEVLDQLAGEIVKVPAHVWREMFA